MILGTRFLKSGGTKMANNEPLHPFYGKQNNLVRCPVPSCGHVGSFISKIHCRLEHDMERDEVQEIYGLPTQLGKSWAFSNNEKTTRD